MQHTRILISRDSNLIPMDDEHLRIEPDDFGLKYSEGITCVGMITNIVVSYCHNDSKNILLYFNLKLMLIANNILCMIYLQMHRIYV